MTLSQLRDKFNAIPPRYDETHVTLYADEAGLYEIGSVYIDDTGEHPVVELGIE